MTDEVSPTPKAAKKKRAAKKQARKAKRAAGDAANAKRKPWTFPKNTLEDAIRIPKEIEEKNAGNPMPAADLARAVGFRLANDWRFQDLVRSADQYGLVERTGGNISLTKLGQDVVAPSSPSQRSEALLTAFRSVKDFEAVEKFYNGKRIPEDEFFLNTLTREFNIPRDRVETFAKIFVDNLKFLRALAKRNPPSTQTPAQPSTAIRPTPRLPLCSSNLVDRHLVRDAAQRHASESWL